MGIRVGAAVVLLAVLVPEIGKAQALGDPIFYAGAFYYPSGPSVFFDPYVMVQTGMYEGVPLYTDATLEPYSIVFVPIGGNLMRPYERRRTGPLEGTVGSRTPSFPIDRDVDVSARTPITGLQFPPRGDAAPEGIPESISATGAGGRLAPKRPFRQSVVERARPSSPEPTHVESIPRPSANAGIWVQYAGARWRAAGAALDYVPERFIRVGDYHAFPVYRQRGERVDRIYVPAVEGGPLTRYERP